MQGLSTGIGLQLLSPIPSTHKVAHSSSIGAYTTVTFSNEGCQLTDLKSLLSPYSGFFSLPKHCHMLPAWLSSEYLQSQHSHTYMLVLKAAKGTGMQIMKDLRTHDLHFKEKRTCNTISVPECTLSTAWPKWAKCLHYGCDPGVSSQGQVFSPLAI